MRHHPFPDPSAAATPVGAPVDPAVAARLADEYRIVRRLSPGGLGDVFLAEDLRLGRPVALKLLHPPFWADDDLARRTLETAMLVQRLRHPNVVATHDCGRTPEGMVYVAMEWVDGRTLAERLSTEGRLPLDAVVDLVTQCGEGLDAAHRLGIVHRNVTPKNVLLGTAPDGRPQAKIFDFSAAKDRESSTQTVTGCIVATPAYMSYEQATGLSSSALDGRSDVYSLGLVTYAMLAGHPPFQAETPVACVMKHVSETPAPIGRSRPDIPPAVDAAVLRALEKDRELRYRTAPEFAAALAGAAAGAAAPVAEAAPTPPPTYQPPWRRRPIAAAGPGAVGATSPLR
jgi:serine/threonine protein kinase